MNLERYAEALGLLGDENRLRLCALLAERELCVSELVRVTGLPQSRVSTHLARMRDAGVLRHRRSGTQTFYGLAHEGLTKPVRDVLDEVAASSDKTLQADRKRLAALDAERREGLPESVILELDRDYSPGRTWQSLALGHAALLRLGDVLDVGSGDGTAASVLAPYCRSLMCIDTDARAIGAARDRLARHAHALAQVADVHALPFDAARFDDVLVFHTLTYAEHPEQALSECARVLRPGGRVVILCLDRHESGELSAHYGMRHPGFTPRRLSSLLRGAGLTVCEAELACREAKKPHLRVVLAVAEKPQALSGAQQPTRSTGADNTK
ncbi:MAG: metalloregulator ArsR/SmtB family transcription factor [Myxococcales bacterium]|nr:metalloregulator ArsR/SmtB family transcription factor [Myxococcales bacterium]MDD9966586.1 metalloregulator ArsR/SmtB family transcription factor [Myxococcales bacterium]